ncbi:probable prefoldin subunit 4 [Neodiprion pinetum]|uniref:Prefoldin subunit 4 n=1 Tax=Neodiprion lecontei TaxID=441921 RepID=A0A6J0BVZ6_NEOLC|nr:probable prefoldin subunit 4 [Neodiprion lecontei]XP_046416013.1 probable prefoldin subunit 4 [Neodiprion fabricii]XP_046467840.1 probable prefoldin subunit 4 [Neodiprion pinetum]XP_046605385.1 probable prefoldin subunit 4 [Neodiprion virginianus]
MAGGKNSQGGFQPDSDVHITYEDQQKINKFARHNAKLEDYKDELKSKQNDIKNLEDACDELSLFDDDVKIPYLIGEVFVDQDFEKTQKSLEEAKAKKQAEIAELESKSSELKVVMSDLKAQLYAKFGTHINLEAEDE